MMDQELKKLYDIFYAENYDDCIENKWFIGNIEEINQKFNLSIPVDANTMKSICKEIYFNDNIELAKHMILGSTGFDWDRYDAEYDFEPADWVDDDENRRDYDETYGEQGTDYYVIETKSKQIIFSHLRHFDLPYSLSEIIDKGVSQKT
jgi:hypothetical protein